MSQAELARAAGISVSFLCLLEKNKREASLSTVEAISTALTIPASILIFLAADTEQLKELTAVQIENLTNGIMDLLGHVSRQETLF